MAERDNPDHFDVEADPLQDYWRGYFRFMAKIPHPTSSLTIQRMTREGHGIRDLHKQLGYSPEVVAERMSNIEPRTEISPHLIRAFEAGIVPTNDLPEDFHSRLHQALKPQF